VLTEGRLIQRYKRFLADVELADGAIVTAHLPNSRASSDHPLERIIVTREDGEVVWAEPRLDQAA
jgi:sugar fermentation stimulation protein A